jgi:hypothetical protein
MAGVPNSKVKAILGWPAGVNNRAPENALPSDEFGNILALRQAVNVNISNEGKPSRRSGFARRITGSAHSLFRHEGHMLAVVDNDLVAYTPDLAPATVRAGLGSLPVGWAGLPEIGLAWWTNSQQIRCVGPNLEDLPLWIDAPGQLHAAPVVGQGGLHAGRYQVAVTYRDGYGRESGTMLSAEVDVEQGGGIAVSAIPANAAAVTARVYVSDHNGGDVLYWAMDIAMPATGTYLVGAGTRGKPLETQWLEPLPPGQLLEVFATRLIVARGATLFWSEPLYYGLTHLSKNYASFGGEVTLLKAVAEGEGSAGMFIATDTTTYFVSDANPKNWARMKRYPHGAVAGTGVTVSGSVFNVEYTGTVAFWLATNGVFCLGLPGGTVLPLTDRTLALPGFERGASLLRERNGVRSILTTMLGGSTNALAMGDSAVAEIRRHGVTVG